MWFCIAIFIPLAGGGCCFQKEVHHQLDVATRALIPYNRNSAFEMQDSAGNRATFKFGTATDDFVLATGVGDECPLHLAESYRLGLRSSELSLAIWLSVMQDGDPHGEYPPSFQVALDDSVFRYCEVPIGACGPSGLPDPCLDNFAVGSKIYNDVLELKLLPSTYGVTDSIPPRVWYVPYFGIVKMALPSGEVWELVD